MPVSAEGRVENQKLNQTAALLSFGRVFGFQLDSLEKHVITLAVGTFTGFSIWSRLALAFINPLSRTWDLIGHDSFFLILNFVYLPERRISAAFSSWGPFDLLSYIILGSHS